MTLRARELPSLRHSVRLTSPDGRAYRLAADEPRPGDVPTQLRHGSTMPGGYSNLEFVLARDPNLSYAELGRFSLAQLFDATDGIVSEARLERAPKTSGEHVAVSPGAAGWQAHLDDNQFAHALIIDRRLNAWNGPGRQRQIDHNGIYNPLTGPEVVPDKTNRLPAMKLAVSGELPGSNGGAAEAWYDAGDGNLIGGLHLESTELQNIGGSTWEFIAIGSTQDRNDSALVNVMADQNDATVAFRRDVLSDPRQHVAIINRYLATYTADAHERWRLIQHLAVIGDHGLDLQEVGAGEDGFLGSDIVAHIIRQWAPLLRLTRDSIEASLFVIPHLDPWTATTAGEMVRQTTRFGLQDWAVWDNQTFYWHSRGARGRRWRLRVGPSQLEETGVQADSLWDSVVVQYQDADGSNRTVGPPGAGVTVEHTALLDTDPNNPAVKAGVTRRALLAMGVSTPAGAIEVGRRFLEEQKLLDTSGRAVIVGYAEDASGVLHPFTHVKAGDLVTFIDASDQSYRRIVSVSHDHSNVTASIDLDSPPEGLAALLERLGVVLVALNVG